MKNKETKVNCKTCTENKNGYCKLKIKDNTPTEYAKVKGFVECGWYREKK